jgi:hypothetical protein
MPPQKSQRLLVEFIHLLIDGGVSAAFKNAEFRPTISYQEGIIMRMIYSPRGPENAI